MQEGPRLNLTTKSSHTERAVSGEKMQATSEKFEKMVRYAGLAGFITVASYVGKETHLNYQTTLANEAHVVNALSAEEFEEYTNIKDSLKNQFGEPMIAALVTSDRMAVEKPESEKTTPVFEGFENESALGEMANIYFYPDFAFTESFGMYPEGWLNGEISKVIIKDGNEARQDGGNVVSGLYYSNNSSVIIYDASKRFADPATFPMAIFHEYMRHTFAHEAGHANDWESKNDLTLLERAQFLQRVTERMMSKDAYSDKSLAGGLDYWRSFDDDSGEGARSMAKEYWAEICAAYFTEAERFKEQYPEDFALVQEMITRTDNDFDIFDPERGAFDPKTGLPRDKWLADVQELRKNTFSKAF